MSLIDRNQLYDKFIKEMKELIKSTTTENVSTEALSLLCGAKLIYDMPTIEFASVVRCKECIKRYTDLCPRSYVELDGSNNFVSENYVPNDADNWFCADGERVMDNGET